MAYESLYEGVSGLNSQMKKMEVVGNNLANLSTAGFKKDRVTFRDLYYETLDNARESQGDIGGINSKQIGTGVDVSSIDTIFNQGSRMNTDRELDFFVNGPDFFVVQNGVNEDTLLTRSGSFELDGNMNLVDNMGNSVIGKSFDPNTGVSTVGGMVIDTSSLEANATTGVEISENIDLSIPQQLVEEDSQMWTLFSGGENFGDFDIASTKVQGDQSVYGSGFYSDSQRYTLNNLQLLSSSSALSDRRYIALENSIHSDNLTAKKSAGVNTGIDGVEGVVNIKDYKISDVLTISQFTDSGVQQVERMIEQVDENTNTITFSSTLPSDFETSLHNIVISRYNGSIATGGTLHTQSSSVSGLDDVTGFSANDTVVLNGVDQATGEFHQQNIVISSIDETTNTITLQDSLNSGFSDGMSNITLYKTEKTGFSVEDTINLLDSSGIPPVADSNSILAFSGGLIALSSSANSKLSTTSKQLIGTNLTDGYDSIGSSEGEVYNDLLRSQISIIDNYGNLIASFYRVSTEPADYNHATATQSNGETFTVGSGEFSSWNDFNSLVKEALSDTSLDNNVGSEELSVTIDSYGKITFGGTGQVENFFFVVNEEATGVRSMLGDFLYEGEASNTQALLNREGTLKNTNTLTPLTQTIYPDVNSTNYWFDSEGIEDYGYSEAAPSTGYAEFAGMRLDGSIDDQFGKITISMQNGLGQIKEAVLKVVSRNPSLENNEFSTIGEFVNLIKSNLQDSKFSTVIENGKLVSDSSVTVNLVDGRIVVETDNGVFNNLTITPDNKDKDSITDLTDYVNFGTVLGDLAYGINGKVGRSNLFVDPDVVNSTIIFDSMGNEHTAKVFFTRDRTQKLENVEWKVQTTLNPNLNTSVSNQPESSTVYRNTFNSVVDSLSRSVLAFDTQTGDVLDDTQPEGVGRYKETAFLEFFPLTDDNSDDALEMEILFDLSKMSSFNGKNTLVSTNLDGYGYGTMMKLVSEETTGRIQGVYSNGETKTLGQLGLMHIGNPGGLDKVGMNNYKQTANANPGGVINNLDQVFFIGDSQEGIDGITSTIGALALESSNVELTTELTEMIVTQRSYSASGKVITTSDQMYQEALSLVR